MSSTGSLRAKITGTGMCIPDRVVTNHDLAGLMDTSDEWIRQRTGIVERHWIEEGQQPSELAEKACRDALEAVDLEPSDIDCILLGTLSSQADFPGTSFFLQAALGLEDTPCMDVRAQCSGFLYSLQLANALVRSATYRRVLVVGCEVHSTGLDISTRGRDVSVIFGDGAAAVVVEANDDPADPSEILEVRIHSQGEHAKRLWVEAPGSGISPSRLSHEMIDDARVFPHMEGRFVFKHAVTRMPEVMLETLGAASLKLEDVDLFLFHQANLRINEFVAQKLEIPAEKIYNNIQHYGNCSAASIPILLHECQRDGLIERGQLVSMTAFGSGFTWASAAIRF